MSATVCAAIVSSRFGPLDAAAHRRFDLLRPLAGFPSTASLLLVEAAEQAPFAWLQSAQEPEVAFPAIPVALASPGYELRMAPWDRRLWGRAPYLALALVAFRPTASVNLAAPVLLDARKGRALQCINARPGYALDAPLAQGS